MSRREHISMRAKRHECRTRALRGMVRGLCAALGLAAGFLVFSTGKPQEMRLAELQDKLHQTQQREEEIQAELHRAEVECKALRDDPEYLELHARDRWDYSKEGERVLRFHRNR